MKYARISEEAVKNAIYMYRLGHKDIVDNLLYPIAQSENLKLLTIDEELIEFVEKHGLTKEVVIEPEELE